MYELITAFVTILFLAALILLIFFVYVPKQQYKNRIKSEAKKRAEADKVLADVPTSFLQRSCKERCYQDNDFEELFGEVFN